LASSTKKIWQPCSKNVTFYLRRRFLSYGQDNRDEEYFSTAIKIERLFEKLALPASAVFSADFNAYENEMGPAGMLHLLQSLRT
jgi:hypothetical protein